MKNMSHSSNKRMSEAQLPDLSFISPTLAGMVLKEANRIRIRQWEDKPTRFKPPVLGGIILGPPEPRSPGILGPAPEPHTAKERAEAKVGDYGTAINGAIRLLVRKLAVDLVYLSAIAIFLLLGLFLADFAGKVSTVGLGGTSIVAKGGEIKDTVEAYWTDRNKLENSRDNARSLLRDCGEEQDDCWNGIIQKVEKSLNDLDQASTKDQKSTPKK